MATPEQSLSRLPVAESLKRFNQPTTTTKMAELVSREVAEKDVSRWLDTRRVSEKKRGEYSANIEDLIEAVSEGRLIVDDSGYLTQKLEFPMGESGSIKELKYHPRITVGDVRQAMNAMSAKSSDADARVISHIAASTKVATNVIQRMDTSDYSLSQAVAIFFL